MRGEGGPVHVDPAIHSYPLCDTMIAAGETMGMKRVDDLNGSTGPRVGLYTHNIAKGKRQSSARTFLDPARKRSNVKVITGALAERILFTDGKASGVACNIGTFQCSGEIIISAGAMESPLLLQRSGIGDAERLRVGGDHAADRLTRCRRTDDRASGLCHALPAEQGCRQQQEFLRHWRSDGDGALSVDA